MSCYDCIHGPNPCERWEVEGHRMLCQESKDYNTSSPLPPAEVDTGECIVKAERVMAEIAEKNVRDIQPEPADKVSEESVTYELRSTLRRLSELHEEEYELGDRITSLGKELVGRLREIKGWEVMFKNCKEHYDRCPNEFFGWCSYEPDGDNGIEVVKGYSWGDEITVMRIRLDQTLQEQVDDALAEKRSAEEKHSLEVLKKKYYGDMRVLERLGLPRVTFEEWREKTSKEDEKNTQ